MSGNKNFATGVLLMILAVVLGFAIGTFLRINTNVLASMEKLPFFSSSDKKIAGDSEQADEQTEELTKEPTTKPKTTTKPKESATPKPTKTPAAAGNSSDFEYVSEGKGIKITKYKGNKSTLNIPSSIDGVDVISIGGDAFYANYDLIRVTIPDTVLTIEDAADMSTDGYTHGAFYDCYNLEEVILSKNLVSIGSSAFEWCENLKSITIPNGVKTIGVSAFRSNFSLKSINFPDGLQEIGNLAFASCGLETVIIPSNVKTIGDSAFYNNVDLKDVTFSNGLEEIKAYAFSYCDLETVTIPKSVKFVGESAFYGMPNLNKAYFEGDAPTIKFLAFGEEPDCVLYYESNTEGWTNPYEGYTTKSY